MTEAAGAKSAHKGSATQKAGFFARIALFFRQVLAELKKVQRPTREELGQMFLTVILFVAAIMIFVGLLDAAFGRLTLLIFG
ncbi:preprotein translocase subunit SecE [Arcanobacterium haemolyticum]|nr:preprotein translocase subunit SecE [Arcanobacterium haemolyticum]